MVRSKLNPATLRQENLRSMDPLKEIEPIKKISAYLESNRIRPLTYQPIHIKIPSLQNQDKLERNTAITIRKKIIKKEAEIKQHMEELQQGKQNKNYKKLKDHDEKVKKNSDLSFEYSCPIPAQKKLNRSKCNVGNRIKQRYYIVNEHGDNIHVKHQRPFSNESLECMEIMKAAISDVVYEKVTEITASRFNAINDRLDEMASVIKKNENAIEDCINNLRENLKHYGEDTSRHLKYLCMKLEYEKLMGQNFNTFLASDMTQHYPRQESSRYVQNAQNGYYTQRPNTNSHCPASVISSCCRHVTVCKKCSLDSTTSTSSDNNPSTTNKLDRSQKNIQSKKKSSENVPIIKEKSKNHIPNSLSIPDILNSFIKHKIDNSISQTSGASNDNQNISFNCSNDILQSHMAQVRLRDILDNIQQYYRSSSSGLVLKSSKIDIKSKEEDEDTPTTEYTDDTEESKGSVEESEENYCDGNE